MKSAQQHNVKLTSEDWEAIFDTPSDTERHAARRLRAFKVRVRGSPPGSSPSTALSGVPGV